jgi:hypothetical protein
VEPQGMGTTGAQKVRAAGGEEVVTAATGCSGAALVDADQRMKQGAQECSREWGSSHCPDGGASELAEMTSTSIPEATMAMLVREH